MIAVFFSFMVNAGFNYMFEAIYFFILKHVNKDKRKTYVYSIVFGICIGALSLMAVYCNGMIR
jgi:H+/Cl- antiporter ClcA